MPRDRQPRGRKARWAKCRERLDNRLGRIFVSASFKPSKAGDPEPDGVKMQKGQCLEVDAPTQIVLRAQGLSDPAPGGYYRMIARGTFKPQGRVAAASFKLAKHFENLD